MPGKTGRHWLIVEAPRRGPWQGWERAAIRFSWGIGSGLRLWRRRGSPRHPGWGITIGGNAMTGLSRSPPAPLALFPFPSPGRAKVCQAKRTIRAKVGIGTTAIIPGERLGRGNCGVGIGMTRKVPWHKRREARPACGNMPGSAPAGDPLLSPHADPTPWGGELRRVKKNKLGCRFVKTIPRLSASLP